MTSSQKPTDLGLPPREILKAFIDAGLTQADLARKLDVSAALVNRTIHRRDKSPWIRRAIALAVGRTYEGMWGEQDPGVDRLRGGRKRTKIPLHIDRGSTDPEGGSGQPT